MGKTPVRAQDLANQLAGIRQPFVSLNYIDAPHTQVVGRAKMIDPSSDLKPRMAIERVMVNWLVRVDGETGPAGQPVYKPVNDGFDRIRMYGVWANNISADGAEFQNGADTTATAEVTFYGTGLNILGMADSARGFDVYVNNVFNASKTTGGTGSVIRQKGWPQNQAFNAVSNLPLGLYTVRLTNLTNARWWGFEILNESNNVLVPAGTAYASGKALTLAQASTTPYGSFDVGTPNARGGAALVYLDTDNAIKKAVTPTENASAFLTSASHANEEIVRVFHPREFGVSRGTVTAPLDFSLLNATDADVWGLSDDGTHTLAGDDVRMTIKSGAVHESLSIFSPGDYMIFTFVGTGLDIHFSFNSSTGEGIQLTVDNVNVGNIVPTSNTYGNQDAILKAASGLPYGTHVIRLDRLGSGTDRIGVVKFICYGPKKPDLPEGAIELGRYNVMADFVASTTLSDLAIATGVLRKNSYRENIFGGVWSLSGPGASHAFGYDEIITSEANAYVEYTFFGTGCDIRWSHFNTGGSFAGAVTVDGATNLTAYSPLISSGDGTATITAATGVITSTGSSSNYNQDHLRLTGMPLGLHRVRLTKTSANGVGLMAVHAFDIITPIHHNDQVSPSTSQNFLSVGSQGIKDLRKFSSNQIRSVRTFSRARGITSGPTTGGLTGVNLPVHECAALIYTNGNPIEVQAQIQISNATAPSAMDLAIWVDGESRLEGGGSYGASEVTASQQLPIFTRTIVPVSPGWHFVHMTLSTTAGTAIATSTARRGLTVRELSDDEV